MALSPEEKAFLESIEKKIKDYDIPVSLDDCIDVMSGTQVYTIYNDDSTELVDAVIEVFLIKNSFSYFINYYGRVDIPGLGTIKMEPYYFQSEMAKEIHTHRKVVLDKTRQCFQKDNFVMTNRGYISIKDVKVGDMIETKIGNKIVYVEVEDFVNQGKKEIMRVLTNYGAELKLTPDHRVLTKEGFKEAQNLTLNDEIVSLFNQGEFGDYKLEHDEHAALLGYYMADGRADVPSFTNTNLKYVNEVLEVGKLFKNCEPYVFKRRTDNTRQQAYDVRLVSPSKSPNIDRPILIFMEKYNLNKKSTDRFLSKDILNLNEKQMSIMVNRLFAGDGWITYQKDKRRTNYIQYEIGLGSPNYTLIKQIEYILQTKYGIACWTNKTPFNGNDFWKLRITQKKSVMEFINRIGIKDKTDREDIVELISKEKSNKSKQSPEKIRKIERLNIEEEVYDITTSTNDFCANGLVVHNCGMSTIFALYAFWKAHFFEAESVDVVSMKQLKAQAFVKKINSTMASLPEWMKTPIKSQNQQKIVFQHPSGATSEILSESQSENAGRGDSLSVLIMDEVAFYQSEKMVRNIVASAQPTLNKTGGQMILISTPNGTSGKGAYYYEQVMGARSGEKGTKYLEIDWWEIPDDMRIQGPKKGYNDIVFKAIKEGYYYNENVKKKYKEYFDPISREQYNDNEWLRSSYQDLGATTYRQEILHDFIIAGDKVFNEDVLDKVEKEIKEPIRKDKFGTEQIEGWWVWKDPIPGHRYILGCLPTGEKVLTDSGLKDIEKIDFSDKLISQNGEYIDIKNLQEYNCNENIYKFNIEGILRQTSFTGEHPLMVSRHNLKRKHGESRYIDYDFKFTNVRDVKKGDWLIYPNVYRKNILIEENIKKQWKYKSGRKDFDLNSDIILDENFWWFIGIWLAEGWTQTRNFSKSVHTCHNIKTERHYAERVKKLFSKYNRKVSFVEKENVIETVFNSTQLFKFIENNFKKYADKKEIPEWVKRLPEKYKIKLIEGYLNGDGSIFESRDKYTASFVSVSQDLIEGIQDILFSLGFISTLQVLRKEGITKWKDGRISKTKETYQLNMSNEYSIKLMKLLNIEYNKSYENKTRRKISNNCFSDDFEYIYLRIKDITLEHYTGKVYNFETEDHTYLCNYLTTHNCDVGTGTGSDYSSIEIIDVAEYEQVAEYKGFISTPNFVRFIRKVAQWYNEGYIVVESNSVGESIFNGLYYNEYEPYNNMFKQMKKKNNVSRYTGWITDVKTRKLIVNDFIDWITVDELWETVKIYSKRLWLEMTTWIWTGGNKAEHAAGSQDDSIMGFAIAMYNRNKAIISGESFLIGDDGKVLSIDDKTDDVNISNVKNEFGIVATEDETDDFFQERYGVSKSEYEWLIK